MSNRASLVRTEFKCMKSGASSFGFRLYDDYDQVYVDCYESPSAIPDDDLNFLKYAVQKADSTGRALLESLLENEKGLFIDGNWYDFAQIERVLHRALVQPATGGT